MISSGLDTSAEGQYRCVSDDVNGAITFQLNVVGMYYKPFICSIIKCL